MRCLNCSADLTSGARFCIRCGAPAPSVVTCPHCGAAQPTGDGRCTQCGRLVDSPATCAGCGAPLPEGVSFCIRCGRAITAAIPTPAAAPSRQAPPPPAKRPRRRALWIVVGLLPLAGLVAAGVWWFGLRDRTPAAAPAAAPSTTTAPAAPTLPTPVVPQAEPVTAEPGATVEDALGTRLTLPGESAAAVALKGDAPPDGLGRALALRYQFDTPLYSATLTGQDDGKGKLGLSLPAPSADSRVLVLIDERYPILLDLQPVDGRLQMDLPLRPTDVGEVTQIGSLTPGGSIRIGVLTPLKGSHAAPARPLSAKQVQAAAPGDCAPNIDPDYPENLLWTTARCRRSADSTVYVHYDTAELPTLTTAQADQIAAHIVAQMARYATLGYTAAQATSSSPMYVQLVRSGDPRYRVTNGTIYLPLDTANQMLSAPAYDVYHEMAHWIQDEEYAMTWAYWRGGKTWWLEVAAELMVMQLEPAYADNNLTFYGMISTAANALAFQQRPYQWDGDFYVHAQLVRVNLCDDVRCPLNQAGFVAAINAGTYPFDDSAAQQKLSANLDDYARYLLGEAPPLNPGLVLPPAVGAGHGYGELVAVMETTKGPLNFTVTGYPPQMRVDKSGPDPFVEIKAEIAKDGVYPLLIGSGDFDHDTPGLPVALRIAPGAPYWYRLGNGAAQFNDGRQELLLQPIHAVLGEPQVRIVALGREASQTFSARVEVIDLRGAWVLTPTGKTSAAVVCDPPPDPDEDGGSEDISALAPLLFTIGSALGNHTSAAGLTILTWEPAAGRAPAELAEGGFDYSGEVQLTPQSVRMTGLFDFPKQEAHTPTPGRRITAVLALPALVGGIVLPAAAAQRGGRGRKVARGAGWLLLTLGLVGCFGLGISIYGKLQGEVTFDKLEYVGNAETATVQINQRPSAPPLWRLNGTAQFLLDFTIETTVTDENGNETIQVEHCTGPATYSVAADIYRDIILELPADDE